MACFARFQASGAYVAAPAASAAWNAAVACWTWVSGSLLHPETSKTTTIASTNRLVFFICIFLLERLPAGPGTLRGISAALHYSSAGRGFRMNTECRSLPPGGGAQTLP